MLCPAKWSPLQQQELHDTISCLRPLVQTLYTIHTEHVNRSLFQTQQPHKIMTQQDAVLILSLLLATQA